MGEPIVHAANAMHPTPILENFTYEHLYDSLSTKIRHLKFLSVRSICRHALLRMECMYIIRDLDDIVSDDGPLIFLAQSIVVYNHCCSCDLGVSISLPQ